MCRWLFTILILLVGNRLTAQCDSTLFFQGANLQQQRQIDSAISKYTELISRCPTFSIAYFNRGFCYYNKGNNAMGYPDLQAAIRLSENKANTAFIIGNVFYNSSRYDTAFMYFKEVAVKEPANAAVYYKMGRCKWLKRYKILMEAQYKGDFNQDPEFAGGLKDEILGYYNKAVYLDSISPDKINNDPNAVVKGKNSSYIFYVDRATFRMNFGDYAGALKDYETANRLHPTGPAYQYAAFLAKKLGDKQKARSYIRSWAEIPDQQGDLAHKQLAADQFCKELDGSSQ